MNESLDPLESELSTLRPLEMSSGLRRGIAERLAEVERLADVKRIRGRWLWRGAVAGGLIAAGLAAILFQRLGGEREPSPVIPHQAASSIAVENSGTTLLAYERALARSPDEFNSLLDRDAAAVPAPARQLGGIRVFSWSDPEVHALLGED